MIYVVDPIILGSPRFWWALNGRFAKELQDRFKFYTPCLGCRLYAYTLRIPLCKKVDAKFIISGQVMESTNNAKVYQCKPARTAFKTYLSGFGIELLESIIDEQQEAAIIESLDKKIEIERWDNLHCVFEKNFQTINGAYQEPPQIRVFLETFAIPAAAKILSRALSGRVVDYAHIVADTFLPVEQKKTRKLPKKYMRKQPV
jgi:hypothetical protein